MTDFYFIESHECFCLDGDHATVSVSEYAVEQLGEITYVQLPKVGDHLNKGETFGEIESVKTVSDLYSPVSGTVTAINADLDGQPELVNENPLAQGWLLKIKVDAEPNLADYMSKSAYESHLEGLR